MTSYFTDAAFSGSGGWLKLLCDMLNSGTLELWSGAAPTGANPTTSGSKLATLTFGNPAFATPTAGSGTVTAIANAIGSSSGGSTAAGTVASFALKNSGGTILAMGSVGTGGQDLTVNSTSIIANATVSCSDFRITLAE